MPRSTVSTREVVEWLEQRARELDEDELRRIVAAFATVVEAVPEVLADRDLATEANAAAREQMRLLISNALPGVHPLSEIPAAAATMSVVRVWAQRGIDLRVLMRGYRATHAALWRYWMADVAARIEDPDKRMAVLEHSWLRVSAWHEVQLERLEAIYTEERDRWLRGAQARRAELIRQLLAGEQVDPEPASIGLGYELRALHTGLVLWADGTERDADALEAMEDAVRELARVLGAGRPMTLPAGSRALWAWIPIAADATAGAASAMTGAELPEHVHVAVGRPATGPAGFRSSHEDAQLARRLMPVARRPSRLVSFEEVELACLISSEPAAMRRLVAHELGELAGRDPNLARLRETLRVYLQCGANAREAAERLNMHKNTVHYRLARVEELLGHPVGDRRLELEVALMLVHTFGERILPEQ